MFHFIVLPWVSMEMFMPLYNYEKSIGVALHNKKSGPGRYFAADENLF
jgi:hypothetical protein